MKQVRYFYEGETERKLLTYLKDAKKIKAGKLKKFNIWQDKNLSHTLIKNNFDFSNLWIRGDNFSSWLQKHSIKINVDCNYKV